MKITTLILAINLLCSSLHVCMGNISSYDDDMLIEMVQQDFNKTHSCCKSSDTDQGSSENKSCIDGCACCFINQVVLSEAIPLNTQNAKVSQEHRSWAPHTYSYDFTHLIWHPPRVI